MPLRFSTERLSGFLQASGRTDISLSELFTNLYGSRVSPQSISQWRAGRHKPNIDLLPVFVVGLDKKWDDFFVPTKGGA